MGARCQFFSDFLDQILVQTAQCLLRALFLYAYALLREANLSQYFFGYEPSRPRLLQHIVFTRPFHMMQRCSGRDYRPYFWNSQSLLSSGHTCRVLSHRDMQWKWKACYNSQSLNHRMGDDGCYNLRCKYPKPLCIPRWLQTPDSLDTQCLAHVSSQNDTLCCLNMNLQRSIMWFLHIAQLSTTISQAHRATAFHYIY